MNVKKIITLLLAALLVLSLAACGAAEDESRAVSPSRTEMRSPSRVIFSSSNVLQLHNTARAAAGSKDLNFRNCICISIILFEFYSAPFKTDSMS